MVARLMKSIEDLIAPVRYPGHNNCWDPFNLELPDFLATQNRACGTRVPHDVFLNFPIDERSRSTVFISLCATGRTRRESTVPDYTDLEVDLKEVLLLVK